MFSSHLVNPIKNWLSSSNSLIDHVSRLPVEMRFEIMRYLVAQQPYDLLAFALTNKKYLNETKAFIETHILEIIFNQSLENVLPCIKLFRETTKFKNIEAWFLKHTGKISCENVILYVLTTKDLSRVVSCGGIIDRVVKELKNNLTIVGESNKVLIPYIIESLQLTSLFMKREIIYTSLHDLQQLIEVCNAQELIDLIESKPFYHFAMFVSHYAASLQIDFKEANDRLVNHFNTFPFIENCSFFDALVAENGKSFVNLSGLNISGFHFYSLNHYKYNLENAVLRNCAFPLDGNYLSICNARVRDCIINFNSDNLSETALKSIYDQLENISYLWSRENKNTLKEFFITQLIDSWYMTIDGGYSESHVRYYNGLKQLANFTEEHPFFNSSQPFFEMRFKDRTYRFKFTDTTKRPLSYLFVPAISMNADEYYDLLEDFKSDIDRLIKRSTLNNN